MVEVLESMRRVEVLQLRGFAEGMDGGVG